MKLTSLVLAAAAIPNAVGAINTSNSNNEESIEGNDVNKNRGMLRSSVAAKAKQASEEAMTFHDDGRAPTFDAKRYLQTLTGDHSTTQAYLRVVSTFLFILGNGENAYHLSSRIRHFKTIDARKIIGLRIP